MPQFIRTLPSYIANYLTFPGVIIHEWAHKVFCDQFGVRVLKTSYFRFGNPIGYVIHETPESIKAAFWISAGPLLVNTLFALGLSYWSTYLGVDDYWKWVLLWLAFSVGIHAFPSDADIGNVTSGKRGFFGIIGYLAVFPILLIFRLANRLKPYGFDLLYAGLLIGVAISFR